jgi:hypothetical protein
MTTLRNEPKIRPKRPATLSSTTTNLLSYFLEFYGELVMPDPEQ